MKIIILIILIFAAYAVIENLIMLSVRHENLGGDIRAVHISDIHKKKFGNDNKRIYKKTAAENPDIIFISGDIISRTCTDFSDIDATLRKLSSIAPVYIIFGNHEQSLPEEYCNILIDIIQKSGAVLLRNKTEKIKIKDRELNIIGLEFNYSIYKKDGSYKNLDIPDMKSIYDRIGKKQNGENIMLTHNPLFADLYSEWGADFVISGHVHGGIVRIPFTRVGILSPERNFFPRYTKGVYSFGKTKLLVSAGIGKLRLFNPPEIVVYNF